MVVFFFIIYFKAIQRSQIKYYSGYHEYFYLLEKNGIDKSIKIKHLWKY